MAVSTFTFSHLRNEQHIIVTLRKTHLRPKQNSTMKVRLILRGIGMVRKLFADIRKRKLFETFSSYFQTRIDLYNYKTTIWSI